MTRLRLWLLALLLIVLFSVGPKEAAGHLIRYPDKPALSQLENRERSQERNLAHAKYVCRRGGGKHRRWACKAVGWISRELAETRAVLHPVWGPWAFPDSCLRELSRRETAGTYSPTIWNYAGSGAYGIGQALPASKMAPYGADYMTNGFTQLRWMIAYVNGRYGGSCAALAHHNRTGSY